MLRYCKNCGLLLPHDADRCPQCGAPAPLAVRPAAEPMPEAMSQGATTGTMILFAIPVVGFILALVWSFGGTHNEARKRLARAQVVRTLVVAAAAALLVLVAALVFSAVVHSQLAYYYATPYYR